MKLSLLALGTLVMSTLPAAEAYDSLTAKKALEIYDQLPSKMTNDFSTQCGDRAHVWAYLLQKDYHVDSKKLFLYYTPKSFDFTGMLWGFHVATLIDVDGEEYVVEKIPAYQVSDKHKVKLDDTKLQFPEPILLKDWLKALTGFDSCKELDMKNKADLKDFKAFDSEGTYQSPENCIIARTPRAYWWPTGVYEVVTGKQEGYDDADPINDEEAFTACKNIMTGKKQEIVDACEKLLGRPLTSKASKKNEKPAKNLSPTPAVNVIPVPPVGPTAPAASVSASH